MRAYLAAGAPAVCGPFGSYAVWSRMVRSPLVWLGEPDPILSIEEIREEDPELTNIRELFDLWPIYLRLDTAYTTARIIEIAGEQGVIGYVNPGLKELLLRVAATRGKESEISPERLGRWLRRISGRHRQAASADQRTATGSARDVPARRNVLRAIRASEVCGGLNFESPCSV